MDQPAHAEKHRLNDYPGLFDVIEMSRAFPRTGILSGIDSDRRHLRHASWPSPTAFRYVTPRGTTHDDRSILKWPGSTPGARQLIDREAAQST
jgi:hypothetical protein